MHPEDSSNPIANGDIEASMKVLKSKLDGLIHDISKKASGIDALDSQQHEGAALDYRKASEFELRLLTDEITDVIDDMLESGVDTLTIRNIIRESGSAADDHLEKYLSPALSMLDTADELLSDEGTGEDMAGKTLGEGVPDGTDHIDSDIREPDPADDGPGKAGKIGEGRLDESTTVSSRTSKKTSKWDDTAERVMETFVKSYRICTCGARIPANFKLCGRCGKKLGLICLNCDEDVPEGFAYCTGCGNPML